MARALTSAVSLLLPLPCDNHIIPGVKKISCLGEAIQHLLYSLVVNLHLETRRYDLDWKAVLGHVWI